MTGKHKLGALLVLALGASVFWVVANPPGRFGWSGFGWCTFGALPRLLSDFQVRADGAIRKMAKTHELGFEQVEWLLQPEPEVLVIALGWDGGASPDEKIRQHKGCAVHLLKNKEAIILFNQLKRAGKRVAIHYHSTC